MVESNKNLELKKHVATIHSSNKLSLLQRKIANALLFNAYDSLLVQEEHAIHIATLCKLIGYDSHDHKTIKNALVNLLATVIEWNLIDGDKLDTEGIWNASSIIADASIDGPICTYSYSNKMKKLLYRPELYGRLNMLVQAKFKSTYGLALYENCIRFQNIEQTPWFDLMNFRKLMGVEESKYKIFRDFKHRVLNRAVKEVNKYSPIVIKPQFRKQGRQVISIQFIIQQSKAHGDHLEQNILPLSEKLKKKFGLSQRQTEEVMTHYDETYIKEKIKIVEMSSSYTKGTITNLANYLLCALKEDYQPVKQGKLPTQYHESLSESKNKVKEREKAEEYQRYQNKEIIRIFNKKSKLDQNNILLEFEKHLGIGIYHDIYLRDGLSNILIQDQLCLFIRHKKTELLKNILSFEDFCH